MLLWVACVFVFPKVVVMCTLTSHVRIRQGVKRLECWIKKLCWNRPLQPTNHVSCFRGETVAPDGLAWQFHLPYWTMTKSWLRLEKAMASWQPSSPHNHSPYSTCGCVLWPIPSMSCGLFCFLYQISKLDAWKTKMLLKIKRTIEAGAGVEEDEDEEVDLTWTSRMSCSIRTWECAVWSAQRCVSLI